MEIKQWNNGSDSGHKNGIMIMATTSEALQIIKSLAHQIEKKNDPCHGDDRRAEFIDKNSQYFSISVVNEDVIFRGEKISYKGEKSGKI